MKFHNYCVNRDVFTGKYDCNMLDVVNNLAICTGKECNHCGNMEKQFLGETTRELNEKAKLNMASLYGNTVIEIANALMKDEDFPF